MGNDGLGASIWASTNNTSGNYVRWPGDWTCISCGFLNFRSRTDCYKCSAAKPGNGVRYEKLSSESYGNKEQTGTPPESLYQDNVSGQHPVVDIARSGTNLTTSKDAQDDRPYYVKFTNEGNGLSTSCWAPRRGNRERVNAGRRKVGRELRLLHLSTLTFVLSRTTIPH